jgi:multidrug efflux pump subunit AcrB
MLLLILLSMGLVAAKLVVLKMLPFDNKSEFQIIVDMPEGTALERTAQVLGELGRFLQQVPEVRDYQVYAGTAAPINFNGLVRQYYLREAAHLGDIQVNLVDRRAASARATRSPAPCARRCRRSAAASTPM